MYSILLSLFPLIALIATGYIFKRLHFLSDGFWAGAEKLNYYILFPAMLFGNLATSTLDLNIVKTIVVVLAIVLSITCIILYGLRLIYKTASARFGVYMQSMVRFNTYMGLAVVAALFHTQGMTILAITLSIAIPVVNILSVLSLTKSEGMIFRSVVFSLVKNPLIMSCVVGILFNVLGFSLWAGLESLLKQLAICSLPLGLLCVGAALQFMALKQDAMILFLNTFGRLLMVPTLAFLVCKMLNLSVLETQVLVVFFALPTASAAYILTKVLDGDSQLMAGVISLQTLCSALTLPFIIYFMV
ncbi:AEC family transporter [Acinetobacter sp. ANC 4648]|uniref:AEC family transporter n=1 Tax=Acinetobacter sp. ANC 4648 TaxID=1977875 RepID=UPI000A33B224|nr:AEC family transporter [Acinetobacter sp. ANC 4648]OTG81030.1 transporter [Acinetobacter sp. ANC 4648]